MNYLNTLSNTGVVEKAKVNDNLITLQETNGNAKYYDFKTGNLLMTKYRFDDGEVVITPDGYFSGTGDYQDYVYFVNQGKIYNLDQFFENFYFPNLYTQILQGKNVKRLKNVAEALQSPPSIVEIVLPYKKAAPREKLIQGEHLDIDSDNQVLVTVRAIGQGGGIQNIALYHNGKRSLRWRESSSSNGE